MNQTLNYNSSHEASSSTSKENNQTTHIVYNEDLSFLADQSHTDLSDKIEDCLIKSSQFLRYEKAIFDFDKQGDNQLARVKNDPLVKELRYEYDQNIKNLETQLQKLNYFKEVKDFSSYDKILARTLIFDNVMVRMSLANTNKTMIEL